MSNNQDSKQIEEPPEFLTDEDDEEEKKSTAKSQESLGAVLSSDCKKQVDQLAVWLSRVRRCVVITGAGVSTSGGIPVGYWSIY
jgi:hypothetical protein